MSEGGVAPQGEGSLLIELKVCALNRGLAQSRNLRPSGLDAELALQTFNLKPFTLQP
jgi:hypothetical protein